MKINYYILAISRFGGCVSYTLFLLKNMITYIYVKEWLMFLYINSYN